MNRSGFGAMERCQQDKANSLALDRGYLPVREYPAITHPVDPVTYRYCRIRAMQKIRVQRMDLLVIGDRTAGSHQCLAGYLPSVDRPQGSGRHGSAISIIADKLNVQQSEQFF